MNELPITRMTLYKHGIGYYERRAKLSGSQVSLTFRTAEMNDILKSLTVIDLGEGQVTAVGYATPQAKDELLAGCSVRLDDQRSLRDLLISLRGREVRLRLDQDEQCAGALIGLDETDPKQPMGESLVTVLQEPDLARTFPLNRVQGVDILDERGANDLRFFLRAGLAQEHTQTVTIRLTDGEHELSVSYIAPAPTWRVSYRLALDSRAEESRLLLQGWGIFDNRLDEDLKDVTLTLVAGMPISFVYDLYQPFTPKRPEVKEEQRTAAAPVEFGAALEMEPQAKMMRRGAPAMMAAAAPMAAAGQMAGAPPAPAALDAARLAHSASAQAAGQELGELFQYALQNPVSVERGQSALAPIISQWLKPTKDLLYNASKLPTHPVATLRIRNETGLTLERGPVTIFEGDMYAGEAILPLTPNGGEIVAPYAVELGVRVREQNGSASQVHSVRLHGALVTIEQWDMRWREYQLSNQTEKELRVLVEHPRLSQYELADTPEPAEKTEDAYRFAVQAKAHAETILRVNERRLVLRKEELYKQTYAGLQQYLRQGLINPEVHAKAAEILRLWEQAQELEKALNELEDQRAAIFRQQQQIQGNMAALGASGKEGALRARYVSDLEASEDQLKELRRQEEALKQKAADLEEEITRQVKALE
jgi:hypothetical protein